MSDNKKIDDDRAYADAVHDILILLATCRGIYVGGFGNTDDGAPRGIGNPEVFFRNDARDVIAHLLKSPIFNRERPKCDGYGGSVDLDGMLGDIAVLFWFVYALLGRPTQADSAELSKHLAAADAKNDTSRSVIRDLQDEVARLARELESANEKIGSLEASLKESQQPWIGDDDFAQLLPMFKATFDTWATLGNARVQRSIIDAWGCLTDAQRASVGAGTTRLSFNIVTISYGT